MTDPERSAPARAIVLGGMFSLAAAMGIGRFAFTPLLPLMARDGQLDLAAGGWLAAANFLGYFAGALTAARLPLEAGRLARLALLLVALATAGMAWSGFAWWLLLRFLAGLAAAWVFVATSVWCLGALAGRGQQGRSGWVYTGVGIGTALTGLYCLAASAAGVESAALWVHLGVLGLVLMLPVLRGLKAAGASGPAAVVPPAPGAGAGGSTRGLVLCYGLMGFGYSLPATYLPALARHVVDDPRLFGLAWPLFGTVAALSTILAGRLGRHATRLQQWAVCQALMGVGALLPGLWLNGPTIALSALLVGGTFMVITLAGVQEMRVRAPQDAARRVGQITAAFAVGQIAGPVTSALLLQVPALGQRGLDLALQLGAAALIGSACWLARQAFPPTFKETRHA